METPGTHLFRNCGGLGALNYRIPSPQLPKKPGQTVSTRNFQKSYGSQPAGFYQKLSNIVLLWPARHSDQIPPKKRSTKGFVGRLRGTRPWIEPSPLATGKSKHLDVSRLWPDFRSLQKRLLRLDVHEALALFFSVMLIQGALDFPSGCKLLLKRSDPHSWRFPDRKKMADQSP